MRGGLVHDGLPHDGGGGKATKARNSVRDRADVFGTYTCDILTEQAFFGAVVVMALNRECEVVYPSTVNVLVR